MLARRAHAGQRSVNAVPRRQVQPAVAAGPLSTDMVTGGGVGVKAIQRLSACNTHYYTSQRLTAVIRKHRCSSMALEQVTAHPAW